MLTKLPVNVKFANGARVPTQATPGAAGLDLYALAGAVVPAGKVVRVSTGVHIEIPLGYAGFIRPRSGLTSKGVMAVSGTIDSDFRGEVQVMILNFGQAADYTVQEGDRIGQLIIVPIASVELIEQAVLSETMRGAGGFGSTGR